LFIGIEGGINMPLRCTTHGHTGDQAELLSTKIRGNATQRIEVQPPEKCNNADLVEDDRKYCNR
jgi:hypothetical protein